MNPTRWAGGAAVTMALYLGAPVTAWAGETESAALVCGTVTHEVNGFGRGQALHVVGSNSNFVVVFAQLEPSGPVIADIKGQRDRGDVVTCTTTTPSGRAFTLRGFFTPRG